MSALLSKERRRRPCVQEGFGNAAIILGGILGPLYKVYTDKVHLSLSTPPLVAPPLLSLLSPLFPPSAPPGSAPKLPLNPLLSLGVPL